MHQARVTRLERRIDDKMCRVCSRLGRQALKQHVERSRRIGRREVRPARQCLSKLAPFALPVGQRLALARVRLGSVCWPLMELARLHARLDAATHLDLVDASAHILVGTRGVGCVIGTVENKCATHGTRTRPAADDLADSGLAKRVPADARADGIAQDAHADGTFESLVGFAYEKRLVRHLGKSTERQGH
jgi:hypothetical protein